MVKRPRRFAQFMPEIFAVDADGSRDSVRQYYQGVVETKTVRAEIGDGEVHQRFDKEEPQKRQLFQAVV